MSDPLDLPDWSGQLLLVNLGVSSKNDRAMEAWLLEFPEWKTIGGRLFLSGRVPEIFQNEWITGREVSVAWEQVTSFVRFDSRKQYEESAAKHKPTLRERFLS